MVSVLSKGEETEVQRGGKTCHRPHGSKVGRAEMTSDICARLPASLEKPVCSQSEPESKRQENTDNNCRWGGC